MGYRGIIPPERLVEFEELGESEVQVRLEADLYSGKHKRDAILFIKLCETEREPDEKANEPLILWHETLWGKIILGVVIIVLGVYALSLIGLN